MKKKITIIGAIIVILTAGFFIAKPFIIDKALLSQAENLGDRFRYDLLKDGKMHVITIGTGSPIANAKRAQPSTAIIADGVFIIIDAGTGSATKADLQGLPLSDLDAVFITHFHSDHIADLPLLASKGWRYGRTTTLPVYGPVGTSKVVDGFNQAYRFDKTYRYKNIKGYALSIKKAEPYAQEITTPGPTEKKLVRTFKNGLKVYAFTVEHAPVKPAFGFRVEYKGKSIVVSGDTRFTENMVIQSKDADLLIHEANNFALLNHLSKLVGDRKSKTLQALKVMAKKIQKYHTSPVQAATIASRAKVKKLVFNHIDPPLGPYLIRKLVTEPFFMKGVSDVYKGEVIISEDGMHFQFKLD